MNKSEIIAAIVLSTVPAGSALVQRSDLIPGLTMARLTPQNAVGIKVLTAQLIMEQLQSDTTKYAEEPSPQLLYRLHESLLGFFSLMIAGASFDEVVDECLIDYRTIIKRLRQVSQDLKIPYEAPKDHLIK